MTQKNLQRMFENNRELTRLIYGRVRPFVAYLMTRCDREAVEGRAMRENGLLNLNHKRV